MEDRRAEKFAKAWQHSDSPKETAKKLGINVRRVNALASRLREKNPSIKRYRVRWTDAARDVFIEAWNSAETLAEVVSALQVVFPGTPLTERNMELVAMRYRREGYSLKRRSELG